MMVLTIGLASAPGAAARAQAAPKTGKHCVAELAPVASGALSSRVLMRGCYRSFATALAVATGNRVHLAAEVRPGEVTQAMLGTVDDPLVQTVIGIDYTNSGYGGSSFTWYVNNGVGCQTGNTYAQPSMPSGWNDVVSSAHSYGGCANYRHFQDNNYGRALYVCTCSSMGVMDNQTSSEKWAS